MLRKLKVILLKSSFQNLFVTNALLAFFYIVLIFIMFTFSWKAIIDLLGILRTGCLFYLFCSTPTAIVLWLFIKHVTYHRIQNTLKKYRFLFEWLTPYIFDLSALLGSAFVVWGSITSLESLSTLVESYWTLRQSSNNTNSLMSLVPPTPSKITDYHTGLIDLHSNEEVLPYIPLYQPTEDEQQQIDYILRNGGSGHLLIRNGHVIPIEHMHALLIFPQSIALERDNELTEDSIAYRNRQITFHKLHGIPNLEYLKTMQPEGSDVLDYRIEGVVPTYYVWEQLKLPPKSLAYYQKARAYYIKKGGIYAFNEAKDQLNAQVSALSLLEKAKNTKAKDFEMLPRQRQPDDLDLVTKWVERHSIAKYYPKTFREEVLHLPKQAGIGKHL